MFRIKASSVTAFCDELSGRINVSLPWPHNVALSTATQPVRSKLELHQRLVPFSQYGMDALKLTASEISRYEQLNHGYAFYAHNPASAANSPDAHTITLDIKVSPETLNRLQQGLLKGLKLDIEYAFADGPAFSTDASGRSARWDIEQDSPIVKLIGIKFAEEMSVGEINKRLEQLTQQVQELPIQQLKQRIALLWAGMGVLTLMISAELLSRFWG